MVLDGIAQLDTTVGENRVDQAGDSFNHGSEEAGSRLDVGGLVQLSKSELAGSIDSHEQAKLILFVLTSAISMVK